MIVMSYNELQSKEISVVAKELKVTDKELKEFLARVVITSSEERLKFGIWNKLRRKKV